MLLKPQELDEKVQELVQQCAFEIWYPEGDTSNIFIPYMMNDAIECYIKLESCTLVGHPITEVLKSEIRVCLHPEEQRYTLVVKESETNTYTIFYKQARFFKNYYRFDGICHFWEPGQEQWAQLVYTIGTMYDKYLFLQDEACNELEKELMHLVEFEPFRAYAPAKQLFEELYDNTPEGLLTMKALAREAGDYCFYWGITFYQWTKWQWICQLLKKSMIKSKRYSLYQLINKKTMDAASAYPVKWKQELEKMRLDLDCRLKEYGFAGTYPDYQNNHIFIRVVEEHPFTIMDWEDITLKQSLMISYCEGRKKGYNLGFFKGKGLSAKIIDLGVSQMTNN